MAGKPHKTGRKKPDKPRWPTPTNAEIAQALTDAEMAAAERETAAAIEASRPAPERTDAERHAEVERIVDNFAEAVKRAQPADRWAWPVLTAALVICVLALATWMNRATIMNLQSDVTSLGRRYRMALADNARIEGIAQDTHAANQRLLQVRDNLDRQNHALIMQNEVDVERWSDDEASMHAAAHDVERATAVLQHAQDRDQFNDRGPMATVLRDLQRAGRSLGR